MDTEFSLKEQRRKDYQLYKQAMRDMRADSKRKREEAKSQKKQAKHALLQESLNFADDLPKDSAKDLQRLEQPS